MNGEKRITLAATERIINTADPLSVMKYSSTALVLENTRVQLFWVLELETFNLKKYSYSNLKVLGLGLKISRVHDYFDIFLRDVTIVASFK